MNFADMVLYNGKVYTVNSKKPRASAVAIEGDKILAVGSDEEILSLAGPATKKVDLNGRLVLPGFNDSHMHLSCFAREVNEIPVTNVTCLQELLDAIAERVATAEKGEWVLTQQAWHEMQLKEKRLPTRWEIDSVAPDNPVIIPRGGHVCVGNSAALRIAGITSQTPDPAGGVICRDDNGEPNGILLEKARPLLTDFVSPPSEEEFYNALLKSGEVANSYGVTAGPDCAEYGSTPAQNEMVFSTYQKLYAAGKLHVRTLALYQASDAAAAKRGIEKYGDLPVTDSFRFAGIKLFQDGGIEGCNLIDPYMLVPNVQTNPDFHGVTVFSGVREQEFQEIMQLVSEHDLMLQTHAVGDGAIDFVLNQYLAQNEKASLMGKHWTICHCMLPSKEHLQKMKKAGITATVQNHNYLMGGNMVTYWGSERANRCLPLRTMLDSGIIMGGGTDMPVIPISPLICIQWMVDRKIVSGDILGADEAVTLEEAVYLWTLGSARAEGMDSIIGSIEAGKKADMVVLERDLFTVPVDEINSIQVYQTYFDGKLVYQQ